MIRIIGNHIYLKPSLLNYLQYGDVIVSKMDNSIYFTCPTKDKYEYFKSKFPKNFVRLEEYN